MRAPIVPNRSPLGPQRVGERTDDRLDLRRVGRRWSDRSRTPVGSRSRSSNRSRTIPPTRYRRWPAAANASASGRTWSRIGWQAGRDHDFDATRRTGQPDAAAPCRRTVPASCARRAARWVARARVTTVNAPGRPLGGRLGVQPLARRAPTMSTRRRSRARARRGRSRPRGTAAGDRRAPARQGGGEVGEVAGGRPMSVSGSRGGRRSRPRSGARSAPKPASGGSDDVVDRPAVDVAGGARRATAG